MKKINLKALDYTETYPYTKGYNDGYKEGYAKGLEQAMEIIKNSPTPQPILITK